MGNKTLVIYDGRRDSSKTRMWHLLTEGRGYLAGDIDEKTYKIYFEINDLEAIGCEFPKKFFYDIRQYIHSIPCELFNREVKRREENCIKTLPRIDGETTIAIYNGRKNRKEVSFFDIRDYICQIPNEVFENEKLRRERIEKIAKILNLGMKYDFETNGIKFRKRLNKATNFIKASLLEIEEMIDELEEDLESDLTYEDITFLSEFVNISLLGRFLETSLF